MRLLYLPDYVLIHAFNGVMTGFMLHAESGHSVMPCTRSKAVVPAGMVAGLMITANTVASRSRPGPQAALGQKAVYMKQRMHVTSSNRFTQRRQ